MLYVCGRAIGGGSFLVPNMLGLIWEDPVAGGDCTAGPGTICRLPLLTHLAFSWDFSGVEDQNDLDRWPCHVVSPCMIFWTFTQQGDQAPEREVDVHGVVAC